jgi:hypothetical protein
MQNQLWGAFCTGVAPYHVCPVLPADLLPLGQQCGTEGSVQHGPTTAITTKITIQLDRSVRLLTCRGHGNLVLGRVGALAAPVGRIASHAWLFIAVSPRKRPDLPPSGRLSARAFRGERASNVSAETPRAIAWDVVSAETPAACRAVARSQKTSRCSVA